MSKVELFATIRLDLRSGASRRSIQAKYQVSWHTVDEAARSAWPAERKRYPRRASKVDPFAPVIDEILRADLDAPRKQRHTARRIYTTVDVVISNCVINLSVDKPGVLDWRRVR
jgi:transposase